MEEVRQFALLEAHPAVWLLGSTFISGSSPDEDAKPAINFAFLQNNRYIFTVQDLNLNDC